MPVNSNENKKNETKEQALKAIVHDDAGLERIREVLVGEELEIVDKRLAEIDQRVFKSIAMVQDTLSKRLDTIETYMKREFNLMEERFRSERSERKTANNELSACLERVESEQATIRRDLLEESKRIVADYLGQGRSLSASLERSLEELRNTKLDRTQLSRTLERIVQEISHEESPRILKGRSA